MQKYIHPQMQPVLFKDVGTGDGYLINSTIETTEMAEWIDGIVYPLVKVDISSASHPAYSGVKAVEVSSSRREAFEKKYARVAGK
jgi:large subunit ribosomal protein L31